MATDTQNGLNITFPIKNADGTPFHDLVLHKATFDSVVMSLSDKITGDVYYKDNTLAVTMQEYVELNGVRFTLINPPTIVREGMVSDNSDLKGMTKYSFEFYHPMAKLSNFPFTDVAVSSDEEKYLSQNKTFFWIGTCYDFIAKLNKNLQDTQWVVVASTNAESAAKMQELSEVLPFDKVFVSDALKTAYETWKVPFVIATLHKAEYFDEDNSDYYEQGKRFVIVFGLPSNEILIPSKTQYQDSVEANRRLSANVTAYYSEQRIIVPANRKLLVETYEDGTSPLIIETEHAKIIGTTNITFNKDTEIYLGITNKTGTVGYSYIDDSEKPFVFNFGQGVGLKNNSRTAKNNKIVTRIVGFGSENNVPFGYPQIVWEGNQDWDYTINNASGMQTVVVDGQAVLAMSYPIYKGIVGGRYVKLIKHPFTRKNLMPSVYADTVNKKVNPLAVGYNPNIEIVDYYDADSSYPNPMLQNSPSVEIHEFEDIKPELGEEHIVSVTPYAKENDEYKTYEWFISYLNDRIAVSTGNEFYVLSALRDTLTSSQRTPVQKEMEYSGGSYTYKYTITSDSSFWTIRYTSPNTNFHYKVLFAQSAPTPKWDDTMDDEGKYIQSYFKITLPRLSFDIYACASITEEMQINMRSGACIGCTFPVSVDWEDYKSNFFHSDGTFDPAIHTTEGDNHVRDGSKYPDSSQEQITVIVQKDINTFGTLMPNIYQQPRNGDQFVILGISLPTSYVASAEKRLDDAMKEYMLENNVYHYDYPLKFDEYFLATHTQILTQMHNNTIVRFKFAGLENVLYIKQMTVKYGQNPLPQYDITLTDDVEVVLNQIGQVTDDVSSMRVQMNELQKYYGENVINQINEKLSRIADDVALGRITFQQGLESVGDAIFNREIRSSQFEDGLYTGSGWRIDNLGNAELESLRVRSYLEVVELLVNRLQAQEGDTFFSDNDQIESVERVVDETDGSVSYILSLKKKYDGYITGQMYGNIVKGTINTLAAKQAGVSDIDDTPDTEHDGSNSYYDSWMRVIGTHNTNNTLKTNQIQVVLYGDDYVPTKRNFEPCELMTIARWGCVDYSDPSDPDYEAVKASIIRRQRVFMISTTEGRVVKYTGVDAPILNKGNYGVTIGELPWFVKNYPDVRRILDQVGEHTDWLYAQGVVVGNYIKVSREGIPVPVNVFCGEWEDGSQMSAPAVGHGIYFYNEYNEQSQQYEIHEVRHNSGRWQCLQHQPVKSGGVDTYYEPKWNSPYWRLVDGNDKLSIEFVSSKGYSFRRGAVDTTITPHLFYGNVDITSDVAAEYWSWTRESESGKTVQDETWDAQHSQMKSIQLTNSDMPSTWSSRNKAIFTCTVTLNDGKTTKIVQNQIIS